jgi:lysyl-tRNA synthetase class I
MPIFKNTPTFKPPSINITIKFEHNEPKKKKVKKSTWELNMVYHYHWATRFSWFGVICEKDGKMKMVKCKISS